MKEVWKILPEFPEYKISNLGRVYSFGRPNKKFIKSNLREGYWSVALVTNQGRRTRYNVHRLVALAFIPNPNNLAQVNHIDGDKLNNCVTNLEWCSSKQNINHAIKHKLRAYGHSNVKPDLSDAQVREIKNLLKTGKTQMEIAKEYNIHQTLVSKIKNNKRYKHVK